MYVSIFLIRNKCWTRDSKFLREGFVTFVKSKRKSTFDSFAIKNADPQAGFALLAGVAVRLYEPDKTPLREFVSRG